MKSLLTYKEMNILTINDDRRWKFNFKFYETLRTQSLMNLFKQTSKQ